MMKRPMTKERFKVKTLLLKQGKTYGDVARDSGLTEATIHNLCAGRVGRKARASRERLTNALGQQIWPGIRVTETRLPFAAGTLIRWPDKAQTKEFLEQIGAAGTEIMPNLVKIIEPVEWVFSTPAASRPGGKRSRPVTPAPAETSSDGAIEIWGPGNEAEALAEADSIDPATT